MEKNETPMIPVINDDASYMDGFGEFSGKNAKKHPELIIEFLQKHEEGEYFFSTLRYKHRYPACWRCKAELVWKVADEHGISRNGPSFARSYGRQASYVEGEDDCGGKADSMDSWIWTGART